MIINQTVTSLSTDAGRQTSAAASSSPENAFSTELQKQLSDKKAPPVQDPHKLPQADKKKPEEKDLQPALPQADLLPAELIAGAALPQAQSPLPTGELNEAAAIETLPALMPALPGAGAASAATLPTDVLSTAPHTDTSLLTEAVNAPSTQERQISPLTAKFQIATPAASHTAAQKADKPVAGTNTSTNTNTNTNAVTTPAQEPTAQPVAANENNSDKQYAEMAAEPIPTVHSAHVSAPVAAAESTPTPAPAVVTGTLQANVGTPAWQQSLGQQIAVFTRDGVHHAELHLHPEELGSLQISLRLNNDQAQLHFVTENHQVRAALESAMPHLRSQLEESGIQLGQSSVGAESFASQGDTASGENGAQGNSEKDHADRAISAPEERAPQRTTILYSRGINTFV